MAAATIMMAVARSETNYTMKGFSQELQDLDINPGDTLDEVMRKTQNVTFGPTDCSLPMKWAIEHGEKDIDVFVVYTDNETW